MYVFNVHITENPLLLAYDTFFFLLRNYHRQLPHVRSYRPELKHTDLRGRTYARRGCFDVAGSNPNNEEVSERDGVPSTGGIFASLYTHIPSRLLYHLLRAHPRYRPAVTAAHRPANAYVSTKCR